MRRRPLFVAVFLAFALASWPAVAMPFIIPFIPVVIAAGAYAASFITLGAFLVTLATTALSFVAQSLLKPAASQPQTQLSANGGSSSVGIDQKQTIRQATAARKVIYGQTRVGGVYAFLRVTDNNAYLRGAIMFAGHECEAIDEIWIADERSNISGDSGQVIEGRYAGQAAYFAKHYGTADQTVDPHLAGNCPEWTVNHRLRGITYLSFNLFWDNLGGDGTAGMNLWTGGIPNITAVIRGKKVYDPRTGLTEYSNNSALCVADYLCDPLYGMGIDYATGINEEALIAAANACDEMIPRPGGLPDEKRYTTDGVFQSDAKPDEIIGRLLGAMMGKLVYDGDRYTILAGVYVEPELTLTDDDMRAMSKIQALGSARDSFNGVKGTFVGPDNKWQAADFPPVLSAAFRVLDGGLEQIKDIELPFTISAGRAQRIAKADLIGARQEITEQFYGKLSCWRVRTGDTILRTSARYGWTEKPFYVQHAGFTVAEDEDGNPVLGVDMVLQEVDPTAFDWDADEESTMDPAPNTNFPDIFDVLPPSNLRVREYLYSSRDGGGVKAAFDLTIDASPDSFVQTGGTYFFRYRRQGATVWTPIFVPDPSQLTATAFDVAPGLYEAEARAVNWAGNSSMPLSISFEIVGLSAAPAPPQNFTVSAHDTFALLSFDKSTDLDVTEGGNLVIKHTPATSGADWDTALIMAEDIPGDTNRQALPLVTGTYLAKWRDASGNYSTTFASFVQFQSSVYTFAPIGGGTSIQDPGFTGAKVNVAVDDGFLKLIGAGDFDDVEEVDDLPSWDYFGGTVASGTYYYDATMDLGSVKRCRITNECDAFIVNVLDDFDTRTDESDLWPSWDGEVVGDEADSWLMVRWTLDNPAGSPTWSEWERLYSSSFQARAFQFKRELVRSDASFTPAIFADACFAEGV